MGHLTSVSKGLSAVGRKRISQFFASAGEPRSRVIALIDSTWVFLLLSFSIVLSWNIPFYYIKVSCIASGNKLIKTIRYPHMRRYDIFTCEDIDDFSDIKFVS